MHAVIRASHLGKQYAIGSRQAYGSLRDTISHAFSAPFRKSRASAAGATAQGAARTIWALKDVSFDINDGAIVGIIGRNGSGKSTLLKILSRITEPTTGTAQVWGRVGSLLEVGTGFHPELTGRENVFVNGAILGMRRKEIERQFDEIVAFAEVERFIDTPVKHYSSGMQMRLAFAVAAHLQPNILLVDEVLAVGDIEFQRRCLGKMKDVSLQGRTVVLVSHQMNQIRRLCSSAIWLNQGRVEHIGDAGDTIRRYEQEMTATGESPGAGECFTRWEIPGSGHVLKVTDRPFTIRVHLRIKEHVTRGHYGLSLMDDRDEVVAGWAFEPVAFAPGRHVLDVTIPQLPLRPGSYGLSFALFNGGNNLTGGVLVEKWVGAPMLTLDVAPVAHPQDAWAGMLNVPASFTHSSDAEPGRAAIGAGEPVASAAMG